MGGLLVRRGTTVGAPRLGVFGRASLSTKKRSRVTRAHAPRQDEPGYYDLLGLAAPAAGGGGTAATPTEIKGAYRRLRADPAVRADAALYAKIKTAYKVRPLLSESCLLPKLSAHMVLRSLSEKCAGSARLACTPTPSESQSL